MIKALTLFGECVWFVIQMSLVVVYMSFYQKGYQWQYLAANKD